MPEENFEHLVGRFSDLSKLGLIRCRTSGPGAVSRELAMLLNQRHGSKFEINGFHIFSHRISDTSRMTLFAKTPDWARSRLTSSAQILDQYGYSRNGVRKLNCTLRYREANTQGLYLDISEDGSGIVSKSINDNRGLISFWLISSLIERLIEKHNRAALVEVRDKTNAGETFFEFDSLITYSNPKFDVFVALVKSGSITIDHLISDLPGRGITEKGPLIKLDRRDFLRIFSDVRRTKLN